MSTEVPIGRWKPHRPRGPLSATYNSPGPKYGLPGSTGYINHDPCQPQAPAFSFGSRRFKIMNGSPGPAHFIPSNITAKGKDGTPSYSIYGRNKDLSSFQTPGPGYYAPELAKKLPYRSAPAVSFGARTNMFSNDQTPGPAAYKLPPIVGSNLVSRYAVPNLSVGGRREIGSIYQDLRKTPGPGTYGAVDPTKYQNRPPQYSMHSRNAMPRDSAKKPSPASYKPEKVVLTRPQAPKFSFGIRHSPHVVSLIVDLADKPKKYN
ncbi:outer dense fiber protein 3-like [Spea bombifrons]|uniref:outer dense fiber protein 3-like n=1 Tax=Spea bombifrons TaxID=233779 RepID=UPI00234A46A3|nr:outer dense fiber protein 3-like [Spea bombifrons]